MPICYHYFATYNHKDQILLVPCEVPPDDGEKDNGAEIRLWRVGDSWEGRHHQNRDRPITTRCRRIKVFHVHSKETLHDFPADRSIVTVRRYENPVIRYNRLFCLRHYTRPSNNRSASALIIIILGSANNPSQSSICLPIVVRSSRGLRSWHI